MKRLERRRQNRTSPIRRGRIRQEGDRKRECVRVGRVLFTVLFSTEESQGKQREREEEKRRGRTSPIQRGRIRQKKRMCKCKNESYSPSSYIPKKVKVNREKERRRGRTSPIQRDRN